jgi:hypothetical protein
METQSCPPENTTTPTIPVVLKQVGPNTHRVVPEAQLEQLRRAAADLASLDRSASGATYHAAAAGLHQVTALIDQLDGRVDRDALLSAVKPVREMVGRSSLGRLQSWPRGYPGDFVTVQMLIDGMPQAPVGTGPTASQQDPGTGICDSRRVHPGRHRGAHFVAWLWGKPRPALGGTAGEAVRS